MVKHLFKTTITAFLLLGFVAANAQSAADVQAQIQALLSQVAALQSQLQQINGGCAFVKDLFLGVRGDDVKCLQEYLTSAGYPVSNTGFFGPITKNAVAGWQSANKISPASGYFGRLSRKKYQELAPPPANETTPVSQLPTAPPVSEPAPTPPPIPATTASPKDAIKTGTGTAVNESYITLETGKFYYTGSGDTNRGYLASADPEAFIANLSSSEDLSTCESTKAYSYTGLSSICSFTDASQYNFASLPRNGVRFYDKTAAKGGYSCHNGILLFKQNGQYGGIEFEKVDKENVLSYRYWVDTSGGTNFGLLCSARSGKNGMALILEGLKSSLEKLRSLVR